MHACYVTSKYTNDTTGYVQACIYTFIYIYKGRSCPDTVPSNAACKDYRPRALESCNDSSWIETLHTRRQIWPRPHPSWAVGCKIIIDFMFVYITQTIQKLVEIK